MHTAVGNARIHEYVRTNGVPKAQIKRNGMCLSVQKSLADRLFARLCFCRQQKCSAYALAAMGCQDRHSPDLARGQQAGATNGIAVFIECKQMAGRRVIIIPLEFDRYFLFFNEYGRAHCHERRMQCLPWASVNGQHLILHQRQCTRYPC